MSLQFAAVAEKEIHSAREANKRMFLFMINYSQGVDDVNYIPKLLQVTRFRALIYVKYKKSIQN